MVGFRHFITLSSPSNRFIVCSLINIPLSQISHPNAPWAFVWVTLHQYIPHLPPQLPKLKQWHTHIINPNPLTTHTHIERTIHDSNHARINITSAAHKTKTTIGTHWAHSMSIASQQRAAFYRRSIKDVCGGCGYGFSQRDSTNGKVAWMRMVDFVAWWDFGYLSLWWSKSCVPAKLRHLLNSIWQYLSHGWRIIIMLYIRNPPQGTRWLRIE